jgi:anti-anti-sigma factor
MLDACLQRNVSAGNSDIALDLVGCSYFDSEGIKVLIRALHALGERGKISICGARGAVRRVFEISGLTTIFALSTSVEDLLRDSVLLILVMLSQIIRLLCEHRLV